MSHDVYICYDERDGLASSLICNLLEENGMKCWIKSRDFSSSDSVDRISHAIRDSKCVVLIYSANAKMSNDVLTQIDIAFSSRIEIIVLNIDNSTKKGDLEFFLKNKEWIYAFPNLDESLGGLVKNTSKRADNAVEEPTLSPKLLKAFNKLEPRALNDKLKKFLKISIPIVAILIVVCLVFMSTNGYNVSDDGAFTINITGVTVFELNGKFSYIVWADVYNMPDNAHKYIVHVEYYGDEDNSVETILTADNFNGGIIDQKWGYNENFNYIKLYVTDFDLNLMCEDEYYLN